MTCLRPPLGFSEATTGGQGCLGDRTRLRWWVRDRLGVGEEARSSLRGVPPKWVRLSYGSMPMAAWDPQKAQHITFTGLTLPAGTGGTSPGLLGLKVLWVDKAEPLNPIKHRVGSTRWGGPVSSTLWGNIWGDRARLGGLRPEAWNRRTRCKIGARSSQRESCGHVGPEKSGAWLPRNICVGILYAGPTKPNSLKAASFWPDGFSSLDRRVCVCGSGWHSQSGSPHLFLGFCPRWLFLSEIVLGAFLALN